LLELIGRDHNRMTTRTVQPLLPLKILGRIWLLFGRFESRVEDWTIPALFAVGVSCYEPPTLPVGSRDNELRQVAALSDILRIIWFEELVFLLIKIKE